MLNLFTTQQPYPSRRSMTYARNGMVATSQPLASQAGRDVLAQGGNAVDAAIAAAAVLTVVEPTSCGIGGDAFALVWLQAANQGRGELLGLNASGGAPRRLTLDAVTAAGHRTMPEQGWLPVTVPGTPAAWSALSQRYGRLDFARLLAPAIDIARHGFPLSPVVATLWQRAATHFTTVLNEPSTRPWFDCFTPQGRAPRAGELYRNPEQATTLEALAASQAESFYRGALAERIDAFSQQTGGALRGDDLADYSVQWVEPISVDYRGYRVWEIPPNGQGLVALQALKIIEGFGVPEHRDHPEVLHRQLEALKLAYSDGFTHITDPRFMRTSVAALLDDDYIRQRRALISATALDPQPGQPQAGGTVYLATVDREGNSVSFIQSNYHGFGSGVVVPGTGIALHNRGHSFSLDPHHANALASGKQPMHTIIPGFLSAGDTPLGPFGVMGGFMQPQGHLQVIMNLIDFGLNPQAALDAPRWQWLGGRRISLEHAYPVFLAQAMAERGHQVGIACDSLSYGRGQIILRDPDSGVYCGGTEPRADGSIAIL